MKTFLLCALIASSAFSASIDYKVLATTKTSTMESEMNSAASDGFMFAGAMGGETVGGAEVVVVMKRDPKAPAKVSYKLLATNKTSTMQKELNEAGAEGYAYAGQTVFSSTFGGREVAVILEKAPGKPGRRIDYRVVATNRTSTFEKELKAAGDAGYRLDGMSVAKTSLGGNEQVAILSKE